jgi:folate-binding protein YgfZ
MLVGPSNNDYLVIMSSSLVASVTTRLKMYVMRAKVNIEVLDEFAIVGIHADGETESAARQLASVVIPDSGNTFLITTDVDGLVTTTDQIDQWKLTELRAGISWLCPETSGQFLPQWLGFDQLGAVNYRKGCYPGQEIVARTHYLGKVKRHPRLLCTTAIICPDPMEKLQILSGDKTSDAVITDCSHREDGGCIFVVTRMDPDLTAETIEYQGQIAEIINE